MSLLQIRNKTVDDSVDKIKYLIETGEIGSPTGSGGFGSTGPTGPTGYFDSSYVESSIIPVTGYNLGPQGTISFTGSYFTSPAIVRLGGIDLGTPEQPFANLWVGNIQASSDAIYVGSVPISSNTVNNTLIFPAGSTIGGIAPGTLVLKGAINAQDYTGAVNSLNIADAFIVSSTGETGSYFPSSHIFSLSSTGPIVWTDCGVIQGPKGDQGDVGPQGNQGNVGSQGQQGNQGPQGIQGSQGVVGSQGIQGSQGNVGSQGVQGNVGSQGDQGDIGPQGLQGVI